MTRIIIKNAQYLVHDIIFEPKYLDKFKQENIVASVDNKKQTVSFEINKKTDIELIMTWVIDAIDKYRRITDHLNKIWSMMKNGVEHEKSKVTIDILKLI